jgi:Arc/MetJ family transcription regulator
MVTDLVSAKREGVLRSTRPGWLGATRKQASIVTSIRARCDASDQREDLVRTTIALDDDLVAKAQAYTGLREKSALVREALKALIERESARRLAHLGGSEPTVAPVPSRRPGGK